MRKGRLLAFAEGAGESVMPIQKERPLMDVAVAVEHEIDTVVFQDRDEVRPNLNQVALDVRIVRAVSVGRMMEVNNEPVGGRRP